MKYELKTLVENLKQSNDMQVLSEACSYYKKLKEHLIALLASVKSNTDPRIINILSTFCYNQVPANSPMEDEVLTEERINRDIQICASIETQYYIIMRLILENTQTQSR